jgi:hypothetical protein
MCIRSNRVVIKTVVLFPGLSLAKTSMHSTKGGQMPNLNFYNMPCKQLNFFLMGLAVFLCMQHVISY